MAQPPIVLYTTPPIGRLPASDIESVHLASLLQFTCGPRWGLRTADWAENDGRLPYITHLGNRIRLKHLSSLPTFKDPDADLTTSQRAESLSWKAYINGQLSDLVNYVLYSLPPNYPNVVGRAQLSGLPFPISQYLPLRLRSIHRSRLQHVGLWGLGGINAADAEAEDQKRLDETFVTGPGGTQALRAWSGWRAGRVLDENRKRLGQDEVLRRARAIFDPLQRRLGEQDYLVTNKPTTVDLYLFSHLTFLFSIDWPNSLLTSLLKESYPSLSQYHDRILRLLYGPGGWSTVTPLSPAPKQSLSIWDRIQSLWSPTPTPKTPSKPPSALEKKLQRQRWMWYIFSAGAMLTYLFASGLVNIELVKAVEEEDELEDNEDDEEDDEEGSEKDDENDEDEHAPK